MPDYHVRRPSAPAMLRTVAARRRTVSGLAAAAAVVVALPVTAHAQSVLPAPLAGSLQSSSVDTDSLGSLAPETPLAPGPEVTTETLLGDLTIPWDVVRDPEGTVVTGERGSGDVHVLHPDGSEGTVEADFGDLAGVGESGLMGIALADDFATSREVYTCHSSADHDDNRVTAWQAADDWSALESPRVLVDGIPLADDGVHSGCRILAHPDGTLYIGTGDGSDGPAPQDLDSLSGKILHVDRDGRPAADTITDDSPVLTYGHRNIQGLALRPGTGTDPGQILSAEHGPDVDDEVNIVQPGGNYGWDPNTNGRYDQNVPMTDTTAFPDAVEASWSSGAPTLAPAGIAFLDDPAWGEWNGALAVAMLKTQQIVLMKLNEDGTEVTELSTIIRNEEGRIRSITAEPGGTLLATTSNGRGEDGVLRISPTAAPQE